jgi:hypothetical protein
VLQRAAAGLAAAGAVTALRAEGREVAQVGIGNKDDVAARPSVTTVGPTLGHVLLATEVQAAVTASTRLHVDAGAVLEHAL